MELRTLGVRKYPPTSALLAAYVSGVDIVVFGGMKVW
jgi:hypothetical protein